MKMEVQLRILTLNCWGIPGVSTDRQARMSAIASELATGIYDFVVLQEVWSCTDYEIISRKSNPVLPYSHYFHSGVLGSGLCVLSKGRIVNTLFQVWPLNGYAHRVQHGDWFGGKGVGMCHIHYMGLHINLYTAHLHALYNHKSDGYLSHRVCQAFEFSQFVAATSTSCDLVIVAGDFNAESHDIPYRLLRYNANLLDTFLESGKSEDDIDSKTNETERNTYTPRSVLKLSPGRRIDYVLYSYKQATEVKVLSCLIPLDKIPGLDKNISYSDHEAVVASIQVKKTQCAPVLEPKTRERIAVLEETSDVVKDDLRRLRHDRIVYYLGFAVLLCLLLGSVHIQLPYGLQGVLGFLRIIFSLLMAFCLLMATIWNTMEYNTMVGVGQSVDILLRYLHEEKGLAYLPSGDASRTPPNGDTILL